MEHFKENFEEQFRVGTVDFRVGVTSFGDEFWTESPILVMRFVSSNLVW